MMKGLMFYHQQQQQQQQQQVVVEENMSNLISASNEANSVSSGNRTETGTSYPQQQNLAPPITTQATTQPPKKKRNLPGNPDPDAEIIAMSPKSLLTTNRFICEICKKGFQRDQNLQLHRRGHNLPWKLKQRTSKEVKKKVYVCPEPTCVHHDPSRALGDLTGIKKHFFRKHGEKKWKCDKCSKRYAVQSDWKAHFKTCGTREYRCDCGTLFSRRDSFVTHRAFCDALAEENAKAITGSNNNNNNNHPHLPSSHPSSSHHHNITLQTQFNPQDDNNNNNFNFNVFPLKKEQHHHHQSFNLIRPETIPSWLGPQNSTSSSSIFSTTTRLDQQDLCLHKITPNPNPSLGPTIQAYHATAAAAVSPFPHMSATALLQKAAQMGATMSSKSTDASSIAMIRPLHQGHVSPDRAGNSLNLSARDQDPIMTTSTPTNISTAAATTAMTGLIGHALLAPPFRNKAAFSSPSSGNASSFLHDVMMNSFSPGSGGFEGTTFEDAFGGILHNGNFKKNDENTLPKTSSATHLGGGAGSDAGRKEGLTRDFLGLRPLSHSDILSFAGIGNCMSNQQNQSDQKPWQG